MKCVGPTLTREELTQLKETMAFCPELDERVNYLKLLASGTRLKILTLLKEVGEVCVCDLAEILDVTVAAVSQHLAKFKAHGLVQTRRDAQTIYYSLADHPFRGRLEELIQDVEG